QNFEQLEDSSWLMDLAFLADITDKLNILNLELQGKDKHVAQMRGSVKSFKAKHLVDVTYEDEVSRTFPKYEENGM
ncbi:GTF2I repeat domain containing 2, partial [Chelydra serpentina]